MRLFLVISSLLLLGTLMLVVPASDAQDYPVFRRARVQQAEVQSSEVTPRTRRVRVRVRPRPVVSQPLDDDEDDTPLSVVPLPSAQTQLVAQEPARLVPVTTVPPTYATANRRVTSVAQPRPSALPSSSSTRERQAPVQAIRNYSHFNDDGSFTFGYEAADGSFKEETRGIDCVVRGKYGYIDPEGVRREFTYVSGNPCDPNAQDDDELSDEDEDDIGPPRVARPRPLRPTINTIPVEQKIEQTVEQRVPEDELPEVYRNQVVYRPRLSTLRPVAPSAAAIAVNSLSSRAPIYHQQERPTTYRPPLRVRLPTTTTASPTLATPTTRAPPTAPSHLEQSSIFAFDYDAGNGANAFALPASPVPQPQYIQAFRPQPSILPAQPKRVTKNKANKAKQQQASRIQFDDESAPATGRGPVYTSELVFDPSSGQYTTVLVQQLPKVNQEISLNHRLQAFVQPQPTPSPTLLLRSQAQAPVQPQPQIRPHHHQPQPSPLTNFIQQPHQLQYQPGGYQPIYVATPAERSNAANGQIDQFLRTYNVNY